MHLVKAHGGERRIIEQADAQIIITDHRNILSDSKAIALDRLQRAHGNLVVGGKHGGGPRIAGEQPRHQRLARCQTEFAGQPWAMRRLQPSRCDGLGKALCPFARQRLFGRAADMGDAAVAQRHQMRHRRHCARDIVDLHARHPDGAGTVQRGHHRRKALASTGQPLRVHGGDQHQTIGALAQHLIQKHMLAIGIAAGVGHQHAIAIGCGLLFGTAKNLQEQRAETGHRHQQGSRAAGAQIARRQIGAEAHLRCHGIHPI